MVAVGMLLKKAAVGNLPLISVIKRVVGEAMTPSASTEPEELVERLSYYLKSAKKVVLLAAGSAYERFQLEMEKHQVLLTALSDCLINIYVMESSLAALVKNRTDLNEMLVRMIFDEALFSVERTARKIIPMCSEGDTQKTALAMVRRLLKFVPENEEELCNKIMENLLGRGC